MGSMRRFFGSSVHVGMSYFCCYLLMNCNVPLALLYYVGVTFLSNFLKHKNFSLDNLIYKFVKTIRNAFILIIRRDSLAFIF